MAQWVKERVEISLAGKPNVNLIAYSFKPFWNHKETLMCICLNQPLVGGIYYIIECFLLLFQSLIKVD